MKMWWTNISIEKGQCYVIVEGKGVQSIRKGNLKKVRAEIKSGSITPVNFTITANQTVAFNPDYAIGKGKVADSIRKYNAKQIAIIRNLNTLILQDEIFGVRLYDERDFIAINDLNLDRGNRDYMYKAPCVNVIGDFVYYRSGVQHVELGNMVTEIAGCAFSESDIQNIKFDDWLIKIGYSAFRYCSALETLETPESLRMIGENAFGGCTNLTTVKLNEGLEKIERCAFGDCKSLKSIIFPKSLKYCGGDVIEGCTALEEVRIPYIYQYAEGGDLRGNIYSALNRRKVNIIEY